MSDTATELTPVQETPEALPVPEQPAETPLAVDDDAAVDAALEQAAIDLPDGDKLAPLSEVGKVARAYRGQIKELKAQIENTKTSAAEAQTLKQQIITLQGQLEAMQPYVTAYQTMTQAAQQTTTATEDDSEAEEYAKLLDLYTTEGKPDIGRAKRAIALFDKRARSYAEQTVAPLQQQTISQASKGNLARAAATTIGSVKADPQILNMVWSRLDPSVTATPEGAQHALIQAIGLTVLQQNTGQQPAAPTATARNTQGQFAKAAEPAGDPIFTEKAGGKDSPASDAPLSTQEQSYIKQMGITEKDYRESARSAPWLRR